MPRIELNEPGLQRLAEVQKSTKCVIDDYLSEETGAFSSLGELNNLLILKSDIHAIPIYLAELAEQELTEEAYKECFNGIRRVRFTLGEILGNETSQAAEGHVAVQKRRGDFESTNEQTSASRHTRPASRSDVPGSPDEKSPELSGVLLITQSPTYLEDAVRTISKFNENNNRNTESRTVLPQPDSIGDERKEDDPRAIAIKLKAMSDSQEKLSGLGSIVTKALGCGLIHSAKIQVRHPGESSRIDDGIQHKVFVSCCSETDMWQETICRIVSEVPNGASRRDFKEVVNICKAIQLAFEHGKTPSVVFHQGGIHRDRKATGNVESTQALPTLPLVDMLQEQGQTLRRHHKIVLALNLSHSLLRMHRIAMKNPWTSRSIFFLVREPDRTILEANNPYVPCYFSRDLWPETPQAEYVTKFPTLVAFGRLLLEIALGRVIEDEELRTHHPQTIVALYIIMKKYGAEIRENVPRGYCKAILACIQENRDDEYDDSDSEDCVTPDLQQDIRLQRILFSIIQNLERDRSEFPSLEDDVDETDHPNFPRQLKSIQEKTGYNVVSTVPRGMESSQCGSFSRARRFNLEVFASPDQLFDDGKEETMTKVHLADNFLMRAEDFYVDHIRLESLKRLPTDRKIRVAVLDTGVDKDNVYIRGVCRNIKSAEKRSPFKLTKSFTGRHEKDEYGHGTNVAGLILRLAPHIDLYVAKISEGKESENTSQITKAIQWARECKVDIISMSVGMQQDDVEIEKAIELAESDGIITFAAASNYGGNKRTSFPARMDKVLCIHSSDGDGTISGFNPSPRPDTENFCTLGEGIQSITEYGVSICGTSYATPVAAGFAANILRYVLDSLDCGLLKEKHRQKAFSRVGMRSIFVAMSEKRNGYYYVTPWRRIWTEDEDDSKEDIATRIKDALRNDR